ncbi:hypothetical protein BDZ91DRAFT_764022 [Kalaharituber pfeilii]|nr:hypothetical protein BDZ91DRAFT_764022 [Kalaharituber pfeilii]
MPAEPDPQAGSRRTAAAEPPPPPPNCRRPRHRRTVTSEVKLSPPHYRRYRTPRQGYSQPGAPHLAPLPEAVRVSITERLRAPGAGPCEVTRAFLALCNYNLLSHASAEERAQVHAQLTTSSRRQLTLLASNLLLALRKWQTTGGSSHHSFQRRGNSQTPHLTTALASESTSYRPTLRFSTATAEAKVRDNSRCVVSQDRSPVVAHIVPYSLGSHPGPLSSSRPNVFKLLTFFAGPTLVQRLSDYLLAPAGSAGRTRINRLENLICLGHRNHFYFSRGYFVLEPVGDPLATLTRPGDLLHSYEVRFAWVPRHRPRLPVVERGEGGDEDGDEQEYDEQDDQWDLTQVLDPGVQIAEEEDEDLYTYHVHRVPPRSHRSHYNLRRLPPVLVRTGDVFTLSTNDPHRHPLPHPDLLRLHAAMMRLCRAAGSMAYEDDSFDEFGEEEIGNGDLPEQGQDTTLVRADGEGETAAVPLMLERMLQEDTPLVSTFFLRVSAVPALLTEDPTVPFAEQEEGVQRRAAKVMVQKGLEEKGRDMGWYEDNEEEILKMIMIKNAATGVNKVRTRRVADSREGTGKGTVMWQMGQHKNRDRDGYRKTAEEANRTKTEEEVAYCRWKRKRRGKN